MWVIAYNDTVFITLLFSQTLIKKTCADLYFYRNLKMLYTHVKFTPFTTLRLVAHVTFSEEVTSLSLPSTCDRDVADWA